MQYWKVYIFVSGEPFKSFQMLFIGVSQKRQGDIYYNVRVHQKLHLKRVFKKSTKVERQKVVFGVGIAQKITS